MICLSCDHWIDWNERPEVDWQTSSILCPSCGQWFTHRFPPVFAVSGPSGAGKSTAYQALIGKLPEAVLLEADVLLMQGIDLADDWSNFRSIWLRLVSAIAQNGRPVVLFGTQVPEGWESPPLRRYVGRIHYLALVCGDEAVLEARLRARPDWRNSGKPEFIAEMLSYNRWLQENAGKTRPPMRLLDTSAITVEETAGTIADWVRSEH